MRASAGQIRQQPDPLGPDGASVVLTRTGVGNLRPETSSNWTFGVDYVPTDRRVGLSKHNSLGKALPYRPAPLPGSRHQDVGCGQSRCRIRCFCSLKDTI